MSFDLTATAKAAAKAVADADEASAKEEEQVMILAVPKKGRLHDRIVKMLEGAGLSYRRPPRVDVALCSDLPIKLVFLPAADIASYVGLGNVDMGITGEDIIQESGVEVTRLLSLGFGKCRLAVQAPVGQVDDVASLAGGRIVTSFPTLARQYFSALETEETGETNIRYVSGSVEAACGLGLADAVVDLVETGTTMRAAGLEVVSEILHTECVLIGNPNSTHQELVDLVTRRFVGYITAQNHQMITYNLPRRLLDAAKEITPGKRAPTVQSLVSDEAEEWVAVSALVLKKKSATIMDALTELGATDILLTDLANSRI